MTVQEEYDAAAAAVAEKRIGYVNGRSAMNEDDLAFIRGVEGLDKGKGRKAPPAPAPAPEGADA